MKRRMGWILTASAISAALAAGCVPSCHLRPASSLVHGHALPLTPQIRLMAAHDCQLSREIRRDIVARGSTTQKLLALTFDDGPHPRRTEKLLAVMTHLNVHATFFVVGKMAQKAPYLIQDEILQGSEVANHTFDHTHVTSQSDAQIAREVFGTNDVIQEYTGSPAVLFRPPGGRLSWGAYRALRACGMVTVLWTDDPKDYLNPGKPDPAQQRLLMKRLLAHVRPGGIILLHDGILDTVAILPEFVKKLRSEGYEFVTVTQLLLAQQNERHVNPVVRDVLADHMIRLSRKLRPAPLIDTSGPGPGPVPDGAAESPGEGRDEPQPPKPGL